MRGRVAFIVACFSLGLHWGRSAMDSIRLWPRWRPLTAPVCARLSPRVRSISFLCHLVNSTTSWCCPRWMNPFDPRIFPANITNEHARKRRVWHWMWAQIFPDWLNSTLYFSATSCSGSNIAQVRWWLGNSHCFIVRWIDWTGHRTSQVVAHARTRAHA
jgi:hypothetical protein